MDKKLKSLENFHYARHNVGWRRRSHLFFLHFRLMMRLMGVAFFIFGKRFFDIVLSLVALVVVSPIMIITCIAILLESGKPVFFAQKRMRERGRFFKLWKFRSMCVDAEEKKLTLMGKNKIQDGVIFKMENDPRVTKVGKIIRKYSIDELPQFLNVLVGDMTLVGPRPPLEKEVLQYSLDARKRLHVKPGLTGLWQISGRSDTTFEHQIRLDESYIRTGSLKKDFVILIKTIPAVLTGKGSY